jgi:hypothetical protein
LFQNEKTVKIMSFTKVEISGDKNQSSFEATEQDYAGDRYSGLLEMIGLEEETQDSKPSGQFSPSDSKSLLNLSFERGF